MSPNDTDITITDEQLAAWERVCEERGDAEWVVGRQTRKRRDGSVWASVWQRVGDTGETGLPGTVHTTLPNAEFIAAASVAFPALLHALRQLRGQQKVQTPLREAIDAVREVARG